MGICQHVNYYRVLRNLLLIALTSVVLRYSTPVLPFFILEAEPLIFVKFVSIRSLPSHSLFMVLGPPVKVQVRIYQPYAAVKTQGRDRDSFTQQISMTKLDQSEFFQGHFFIVIQCPFHTGPEKQLECVSCSPWRLSINYMNREFEYERIMSSTSLISCIQQWLNPWSVVSPV